MRISETASQLIVRDTPRHLWLLGLVFVASGAFVLSLPVWSPVWRELGPWERLAVLAIGLAHFLGGLFATSGPAATRTELDRATRIGLLYVRRLWRRTAVTARFDLGDVRHLEIVRATDSEGDPTFQLRLWLAGSRALWLQAQPEHGEVPVDEVERLRSFLNLESGTPNTGAA